MKPREPRRKVLIDARLREDRGWADARILNISSRGLMVRSSAAPRRGAYVEICRGDYRILARVVWSDRDRFGARTQDALAVEAMVTGDAAPLPVPANLNNDRRGRLRDRSPAEAHQRHRRRSRAIEFVAVSAFGAAAAFLAFDAVRETLSKPLNLVEARLGTSG